MPLVFKTNSIEALSGSPSLIFTPVLGSSKFVVIRVASINCVLLVDGMFLLIIQFLSFLYPIVLLALTVTLLMV